MSLRKICGLLFVSLLFSFSSSAQEDSARHRLFSFQKQTSLPSKGSYYIAWGYNKDWYTKTNLHFFDASGDYDFTLHQMKAKDHPQWKDIFRVDLSIPQYGYRMGYYFAQRPFGIEINFDHAKYIVLDSQTVRLTGRIYDHHYDVDTMVTTEDFMHVEHTDGANFLMLNGLYRWQLFAGEKRNFALSGVLKAGFGIVIPRSDVTLWGERNNHCFHVAGQIIGIESGFRAEFWKYLFVEATAKASYANFNKVLGIGDGLVSHRFGTASTMLHGGFQFPLGK